VIPPLLMVKGRPICCRAATFHSRTVPSLSPVAVGSVVDHNVIPVPPDPLNIAPPLAGGWAVAGIVATVFLVRTRRTGWLDAGIRVYDEPGDPGRG
jgi:hypothetical protein